MDKLLANTTNTGFLLTDAKHTDAKTEKYTASYTDNTDANRRC